MSNNLTIYEVNLRQYTPQGTLRAFREHLPRLKSLGVGIIWFMNIPPIGTVNRKGTLGSYYSVQDYYGINPDFGTLDEFRSLVDEIHDLDMYIILDWVANHTAWNNPMASEHPEWYTKNDEGNFQSPPGTNWDDVIDLDLRDEMENDPGNTSVFIRIPFNIANRQLIASMDNLTLLLDYDDGFVAYLNGARVAEANAPGAGELTWDSLADGSNEADPGNPVAFELQDFQPHLRGGLNVLAIHGMNYSAFPEISRNDSDFLFSAELVGAETLEESEQFFATPTPVSYTHLTLPTNREV